MFSFKEEIHVNSKYAIITYAITEREKTQRSGRDLERLIHGAYL